MSTYTEPNVGQGDEATPAIDVENNCAVVGFVMDVKDVGQVMTTGFVIYLISTTYPAIVNK